MANMIDFSKFECPDDIKEAFLGTKNALMRNSQRPLEQKHRAIAFMRGCIEQGYVTDPGGRITKWLKSMTKGECS